MEVDSGEAQARNVVERMRLDSESGEGELGNPREGRQGRRV